MYAEGRPATAERPANKHLPYFTPPTARNRVEFPNCCFVHTIEESLQTAEFVARLSAYPISPESTNFGAHYSAGAGVKERHLFMQSCHPTMLIIVAATCHQRCLRLVCMAITYN